MNSIRLLGSTAVALGALSLAACGSTSFAEQDPVGYQACTQYAGLQKETDGVAKLGGIFEIGEVAKGAGTKAIRDSVEAVFDEDAMSALEGTESEGRNFFTVDADKFEAACEDAGVEF